MHYVLAAEPCCALVKAFLCSQGAEWQHQASCVQPTDRHQTIQAVTGCYFNQPVSVKASVCKQLLCVAPAAVLQFSRSLVRLRPMYSGRNTREACLTMYKLVYMLCSKIIQEEPSVHSVVQQQQQQLPATWLQLQHINGYTGQSPSLTLYLSRNVP